MVSTETQTHHTTCGQTKGKSDKLTPYKETALAETDSVLKKQPESIRAAREKLQQLLVSLSFALQLSLRVYNLLLLLLSVYRT